MYEVYVIEGAAPAATHVRWPVGDHVHAERPPSAEELEHAGRASLLRIHQEWTGG
jgi:hypothetical protein